MTQAKYDARIREALAKQDQVKGAAPHGQPPILLSHRSGTPHGSARGRAPGGDGQPNKLELAYMAQLDLMVKGGLIACYWFHFLKLRLAARCFYDTDFLVQNLDGALEIHETKGFMEDDAAVKLKVAAWLSPFPIIVVEKAGKGFKKRMVPRPEAEPRLPLRPRGE